MDTLPLYIIRIGQDYMAEYVGIFATKQMARDFIKRILKEDRSLDTRDFAILEVTPKMSYFD